MLNIINQTDFIKEQGKNGYFISLKTQESFYEKSFEICELSMMTQFVACYRFNACWMIPCFGSSTHEIPEETQYLLCSDGNRYLMIYALVDKYVRSSIYGEGNNLHILMETGDMKTKVCDGAALYVIVGDDPYDMVRLAAEDICSRLKTCDLRIHKKTPQFADLFGFCTYNAFYDNVTHDKIIQALQTFKDNGIEIGFLIIDVGWQCYDENYTAGFEADQTKFPLGLAYTVQEVKSNYGLQKLMVWHTYNGYWSGIKDGAFQDYTIEHIPFYIPERLKKLKEKIEALDNTATAGMNFYPTNLINEPSGFLTTDLFRFYFDFYSYLRKQGVDGTKLDAMSWAECFGQNKGGRVRMMQQLVSSLEGASLINFNGEHINCSSCSNDFIYNTLQSNVTRTSTDYFPDIPESHGLHILTNAHTSLWMGEFVLPDWDMFQTGGTAGEFHAMSRAISGGPVYCADSLDNQRFDIIRKLTTKKGETGCLKTPARIAKSSLFVNPEKDYLPVKVINITDFGYVMGAFNCSYKKGEQIVVSGKGGSMDFDGVEDTNYYVYSHNNHGLGVCGKDDQFDIVLGEFKGDIFTFAPIQNGYAIIGMTDKYNPQGFIKKVEMENNTLRITALEDGEISIYCEKEPTFVSEPYTYENGFLKSFCINGILHVDLEINHET